MEPAAELTSTTKLKYGNGFIFTKNLIVCSAQSKLSHDIIGIVNNDDISLIPNLAKFFKKLLHTWKTSSIRKLKIPKIV